MLHIYLISQLSQHQSRSSSDDVSSCSELESLEININNLTMMLTAVYEVMDGDSMSHHGDEGDVASPSSFTQDVPDMPSDGSEENDGRLV